VAELLKEISPKTIDRLLAREREVRCLKQHRRPPVHPLLYQRVPVKTAADWDRQEVGNLQLDYVLHCGRSTAGEYLLTLSATDIATGWWEGRPQLGRSQKATQESLAQIRRRLPFQVREVHPDNDSGILNDLLWNYCRRHRIRMSRSRPYQKNDNAWVEQKNWTHVRKLVGYRRLTTAAQSEVLRELYEAAADFRNLFQPAMKLKEKVREGGKVRRVYEEPRTPYPSCSTCWSARGSRHCQSIGGMARAFSWRGARPRRRGEPNPNEEGRATAARPSSRFLCPRPPLQSFTKEMGARQKRDLHAAC
jgi:hypothetical protein